MILLCQAGAVLLLGWATADVAYGRLWFLAATTAALTVWVAIGCPAPPLL